MVIMQPILFLWQDYSDYTIIVQKIAKIALR